MPNVGAEPFVKCIAAGLVREVQGRAEGDGEGQQHDVRHRPAPEHEVGPFERGPNARHERP